MIYGAWRPEMDMDEFMMLFHASVAAVENGEVAEIDLDAEGSGDLEIQVTIRKEQMQLKRGEDG